MQKKEEVRYRKMLFLTKKQCEVVRAIGVNVPYNDYDPNKEDYNKYIKEWSHAKKLGFLKKLMNNMGISILKGEDGFRLAVDLEKDWEKIFSYLSSTSNLVEIRQPEVTEQVEESVQLSVEQTV